MGGEVARGHAAILPFLGKRERASRACPGAARAAAILREAVRSQGERFETSAPIRASASFPFRFSGLSWTDLS